MPVLTCPHHQAWLINDGAVSYRTVLITSGKPARRLCAGHTTGAPPQARSLTQCTDSFNPGQPYC